MTARTTLHN